MKSNFRNLRNKVGLVVTILIMLVALNVTTKTVNAAEYSVTNASELRLAITNAVSSDTITLANDIELTDNLGTLTIPTGKSLTLTGDYKLIGTNATILITVQGDLTLDGPALSFATQSANKTGVNVASGASLTMLGGEISGMTNSGIRGPGQINISGGSIHDNTTMETGGGISGIHVAISGNAKIYNNKGLDTANCYGGGIYVSGFGGMLEITGGEIYNNSVNSLNIGGGIYLGLGAKLNMSGGNIYGNIGSYGGAIGANNSAGIDISSGSITNNIGETVVGTGGAIYNNGGDINITGGDFSNNRVVAAGGAIFSTTYGSVNISNATFNNNVVEVDQSGNMHGSGGAIYISDYANLKVAADVTFSNNQVISGYENHKASDDAVYNANIKATKWTSSFTQGYNNYDINYIGDRISYKVTFYQNDGTDKIFKDVLVDEAIGVVNPLPNNPVRKGYVFLGWNMAADGTGTSFLTDTVISSNVKVYAQWEETSILPEEETNYDPIVTTSNTGRTPTTIPDNKVPKTGQYDLMLVSILSVSALVGVALLSLNKRKYN